MLSASPKPHILNKRPNGIYCKVTWHLTFICVRLQPTAAPQPPRWRPAHLSRGCSRQKRQPSKSVCWTETQLLPWHQLCLRVSVWTLQLLSQTASLALKYHTFILWIWLLLLFWTYHSGVFFSLSFFVECWWSMCVCVLGFLFCFFFFLVRRGGFGQGEGHGHLDEGCRLGCWLVQSARKHPTQVCVEPPSVSTFSWQLHTLGCWSWEHGLSLRHHSFSGSPSFKTQAFLCNLLVAAVALLL